MRLLASGPVQHGAIRYLFKNAEPPPTGFTFHKACAS